MAAIESGSAGAGAGVGCVGCMGLGGGDGGPGRGGMAHSGVARCGGMCRYGGGSSQSSSRSLLGCQVGFMMVACLLRSPLLDGCLLCSPLLGCCLLPRCTPRSN